MISLTDALDYEVSSSRLAARASYGWIQELLAWYFSRKVTRKWTRYNALKNLAALRKDFKQ